jgi:hypothetical protein
MRGRSASRTARALHCGVVSAAHALGAGHIAAAGFAVSIAWWMLLFEPICGVGSFFVEATYLAAISAVVMVRLRRQGLRFAPATEMGSRSFQLFGSLLIT